MRKRRSGIQPIVGGSSLLVIFAVLCLTVFALLGLSTVQADQRLSNASAEAVSDYYEADCAAEELFARLRGGEMPEGVTAEGASYSYICPVSDTQELHITVRCDGENWEVLQWQTVSTAEWTDDGSLDVWDGETIP